MTNLINPKDYHRAVKLLRRFFEDRGFIEVPTQSRLSILAACEDPRTIATYNYAGQVWPLPQTGQMWLEYELLKEPNVPGLFCQTTSFRNEPDPIPGRHDLVFPMFEFETHGGLDVLEELEKDLLESVGFDPTWFTTGEYTDLCERLGVQEIKAEQETEIFDLFGPTFFLKNFPQYTSPFWNMKTEGDFAKKIDVIMFGIETIGSAERSTDPKEMEHLFKTISDGMYAEILYAQFGKDRVNQELDDFLNLEFFPRCGGGIGMTRFIRALRKLEEIGYEVPVV